MYRMLRAAIRHKRIRPRPFKSAPGLHAGIGSFFLLVAAPVYAQTTSSDPWDNAVQVLQASFTSTIARGLSLVAIVVGGLLFAFGEGQSKRTLAGIIFGVGMAVGAANFMSWLFP